MRRRSRLIFSLLDSPTTGSSPSLKAAASSKSMVATSSACPRSCVRHLPMSRETSSQAEASLLNEEDVDERDKGEDMGSTASAARSPNQWPKLPNLSRRLRRPVRLPLEAVVVGVEAPSGMSSQQKPLTLVSPLSEPEGQVVDRGQGARLEDEGLEGGLNAAASTAQAAAHSAAACAAEVAPYPSLQAASALLRPALGALRGGVITWPGRMHASEPSMPETLLVPEPLL